MASSLGAALDQGAVIRGKDPHDALVLARPPALARLDLARHRKHIARRQRQIAVILGSEVVRGGGLHRALVDELNVVGGEYPDNALAIPPCPPALARLCLIRDLDGLPDREG